MQAVTKKRPERPTSSPGDRTGSKNVLEHVAKLQ